MATVPQAAQILGVDKTTICRWLWDGFLSGEQLTPGAAWQIRITQALRGKIRPDVPDGWLPLDQAAKVLGVARQTVLHKVQHGELNAAHVTSGRRKGLRIQVERDQPGLFGTSPETKGAVLTMADVSCDHSQPRFHHAEADPGDRLGVGLAGEQVPGRDGLAERGAGQPEVRGPRRWAHRSSSWPGSLPVSLPSWVKSIFAPVPASSSWAAATRPRWSTPVGSGSGRVRRPCHEADAACRRARRGGHPAGPQQGATRRDHRFAVAGQYKKSGIGALSAGFEPGTDGSIPEQAIAQYNQTYPDRPH